MKVQLPAARTKVAIRAFHLTEIQTSMKLRIISASRRTDIPAFHAGWFLDRINAGWCAVPNPFNSKQVSRVELTPEDTVLVFWTRWASPFMKVVDELERRRYRFYFQYTVVGYPTEIDPHSPQLDKAIRAFRALAARIGPQRIIWRYDPILLSSATDHDYHLRNFTAIADALRESTSRVVVSIVDPYDKAARRLGELARTHPDYVLEEYQEHRDGPLFRQLAEIATRRGLEITSCAEEIDLTHLGIAAGKCIDDGLIRDLFGVDVGGKKDKGQRAACGCVESRDIGMYDSCLFGCAYCYATRSFDVAKRQLADRQPGSESLVGNYRAPERANSTAGGVEVAPPLQGSLDL
jgi:hypothetical protein